MDRNKEYYKLTVAYDGTDFVGFQEQKANQQEGGSFSTVQGALNNSLRTLLSSSVTGENPKDEHMCIYSDLFVSTRGASRTDAGVHAREQVLRATVAWLNAEPSKKTDTEGFEVARCKEGESPKTCCTKGVCVSPRREAVRVALTPEALNLVLPESIRCRAVEHCSKSYCPGERIHSKEYRYFFTNVVPSSVSSKSSCSLLQENTRRETSKTLECEEIKKILCKQSTVAKRNSGRFVANVPSELDLAAIETCLQLLVGTHDFKNFSSTGSNVSTTVRTIHSCDLEIVENLRSVLSLEECGAAGECLFRCPCDRDANAAGDGDGDDAACDSCQSGCFQLRIVGDGFLKQMIRHLMGSLWAVGRHKLSVSQWSDLLDGKGEKQISRMWKAAPARGLILYKINYEEI